MDEGTSDGNEHALLECLERMIAEVDALKAIYEDAFLMSSPDCEALEEARHAVETAKITTCTELHAKLDLSLISSSVDNIILLIRFPSGYPELYPISVSIQCPQWTRSQCEDVTRQLQLHANGLVGQEAVMDIVQYIQSISEQSESSSNDLPAQNKDGGTTEKATNMLGRRWIWVHHITDASRRKSIVQAARDYGVRGCLKYGYPGVVVVEGRTVDCDEFVNWIKGSKSRPGGFGRNWGHHCRGEINFKESKDKLRFCNEFIELHDMRDLGAMCKENEAEKEFLAYVMQHNV